MSSKHTRYLRQIDVSRVTGTVVVFAGGGGGAAVPAPLQIAATDVLFAPAGTIAARNVQGAVEELDAEKLALTGGAMTGLLILSGSPTDDLGAATKWYVDNLDRLLVPDAAGVPVVRLLPDFVRIGHPLQPGLTWTPEQGLQIPASTIVGGLVEYVWCIETFFGSAGPIGAVFYTDVDIRVSKIAVFIRDNNIEETAGFLIQAAATATGFVSVDTSVIGRVSLTPDDLSIVVVPVEEIYDGDTGQSVTSGVNFVVTGEDPLIPAGSWIGLREGNNGTLMGNVTVTLLARYA